MQPTVVQACLAVGAAQMSGVVQVDLEEAGALLQEVEQVDWEAQAQFALEVTAGQEGGQEVQAAAGQMVLHVLVLKVVSQDSKVWLLNSNTHQYQ